MSKKVSLVSATKRQEEFVRGGEAIAAGQGAVSTANRQDGGGHKKKATFNLDAELHKRLKVTAAVHGREMVEIVEEALKGHLGEMEKGEGRG